MTTLGAGRGQPPLEGVAQDVLAQARQQSRHRPVPPLTPAEKAEAGKVAAAKLYCGFCAGSHASPSTAACPRLASVKMNADGTVTEATFWPGRKWAKGRVVFIEDQVEVADDGPAAR